MLAHWGPGTASCLDSLSDTLRVAQDHSSTQGSSQTHETPHRHPTDTQANHP